MFFGGQEWFMARFLLDISGHGHNCLVLSRLCLENGNKVGKSYGFSILKLGVLANGDKVGFCWWFRGIRGF